MRRVSAILLLAIFSFALMAPVVSADTGSKLPACCRRDGQHHCAMPSDSSAPGPAMQAVCPAYPRTGAAPAHSDLAAVRPAQLTFDQIASNSAGRLQTGARVRDSFVSSRSQRGPPALIS